MLALEVFTCTTSCVGIGLFSNDNGLVCSLEDSCIVVGVEAGVLEAGSDSDSA